MDKVGLVAALQNFGQWADGFPEIPAFEDLTHNERVQSAVDTARDHVQNLFTAKAVGPELDLDASELEFSANDDEWSRPYGLEDESADIDNTTETDLEHRRTIDDYAVKAIAKDPSPYEWDNGHGDEDISVNGHIKGGQATQAGLTLVKEEKANKAYTDLLLTQRMKDDIFERNEHLERLNEEIKLINTVQAFVNEKVRQDTALTLLERQQLERDLRRLGLDINDYVNDDGKISDPDKLNDDLDDARNNRKNEIEKSRESRIAESTKNGDEPQVLESVEAEERVAATNDFLSGFMSFSPALPSNPALNEDETAPVITAAGGERESASLASVIGGEEDNFVCSNVSINLQADFCAVSDTAAIVAEAKTPEQELQTEQEQTLETGSNGGVSGRAIGLGSGTPV